MPERLQMRTAEQERKLLEEFVASTRKGVELALRLSDPDRDTMQRLIEKKKNVKRAVRKVVREALLPSVRYADEEKMSSSTYPHSYRGARLVEEQVSRIAQLLDLDPASALEFSSTLPALPDGAEGWFAVPSPARLAAKHFPKLDDPDEQHCAGINLVLSKFGPPRELSNSCHGQITKGHLRLTNRTAQALAWITETQPGDILIIAAQLGFGHRGESVRWAREKFELNEFGLDTMMVGAIALTHPERLFKFDNLHMQCPGDEFSQTSGPEFDEVLEFTSIYLSVSLNAGPICFGQTRYGSCSGFLPL